MVGDAEVARTTSSAARTGARRVEVEAGERVDPEPDLDERDEQRERARPDAGQRQQPDERAPPASGRKIRIVVSQLAHRAHEEDEGEDGDAAASASA